jgi:predicted transcriptional regulator
VLPTQRTEGRYRSKLEVLRDFLRATRQERKKTRIIGVANLNPGSFQRYLEVCIQRELVRRTPAGYELTPRAEVVLERVDRLLEMSTEIETAVRDLDRILGPSSFGPKDRDGAPRYVSRIAWSELQRSELERPTLASPPVRTGPTSPLAIHGLKFWWERDGDPPEPESPSRPAGPVDLPAVPYAAEVRRSSRARARR